MTTTFKPVSSSNQFINTNRAVALGNPSWQETDESGLLNIAVRYGQNGHLTDNNGHDFINMCSCSYLGLDVHPEIVAGGIDGLRQAGTLNLSTARLRIHLAMLNDVEDELSSLFGTKAVTTINCAAATAGILPILASGHLTGGKKPLMVFDKNCHFSINHVKPICGDETEVATSPHNDMNFLEDICRRNSNVAYVADGAYSMGGHAPIQDLLRLQDRYGLFLYFDDSHSLSIFGRHGAGYVRSSTTDMPERTIIAASLGKAFGASGGVVMFGSAKEMPVIERFGGPMAWSQCINPAAMGAILASAKIHRSEELQERQADLARNIQLFDDQIQTTNAGIPLPIRVIPISDARVAVACSKAIFERGYYTSAVFFPIVAQGRAGLRVMPRADLAPAQITSFCTETMTAIEQLQ
jgi:7-keto-8-aminopelargonate synthetase-like enzyme